MSSEKRYFGVVDHSEGEQVLLACDNYIILDSGWVEFYNGVRDFTLLAIPPTGFSFVEKTYDEYTEDFSNIQN